MGQVIVEGRVDAGCHRVHAGSSVRTDTNDAGTYYLTTDQLRFYSTEAPQHYAHAGGGGYHVGFYGRQAAPFEGDGTLAVILSKAFLLAEDWNIEDPTILRQIGR
jgi:hypothetical protein